MAKFYLYNTLINLITCCFIQQYLLWRVLVGLNKSITLSFIIPGHTKFTPDSCFGLFKQRFRKTRVECLDDIVNVVEQSAAVNHAQLVGTHNGQVIVPTYNWVTFFVTHLKKISNITKYHHFTASTNKKGIIISKIFRDSTEIESALLKDDSWNPTIHEMPPIIEPQGMSAERQWYLYDKIRPYCSDKAKDLTCPLPSVPRPGTPVPTPVSSPQSVVPTSRVQFQLPTSTLPPAKRQRICGNCGQAGHNCRSCKRINS